MASRTDENEVIESAEELETNYPVNTKQQKPGSSAKFHETEGQSQELLIANFERLIHHLNSRLEEKKEIKSLKKTLFEKQLIEKEKEIKKLQKKTAAELDAHKKEIQNLKSENQKLTNELASCKDDAGTELNKMMTVKEEAIKKLQNDINIEKTRTASVEQQLRAMLATATAEKDDLKSTKTKLEEKVKGTESRIKLLQSENSSLQKEIAELDPNKKEIQRLKDLLENNHSLRKLNEVDLRSKLNSNSTSPVINNRKINYVAPGTFDNFSSLTELDFRGNGLTFLEKGVFNNLTNLTHLNLYSNYLTCLEGNVFAGLKKLKEIYLSRNNITTFPPQLFRGLESLEIIDLSCNKISVFDEDLLVGLNRLTSFIAHNDHLTSIPEKLFGDCVQLKEIWLHSNKIVGLKKTIFDSLHNLKRLDLHNNPLDEMDKNALRMSKIGYLRI